MRVQLPTTSDPVLDVYAGLAAVALVVLFLLCPDGLAVLARTRRTRR